ncbi:MAG: hypothetical protein HYR62_04050 [Actinobacteria bacterium]|nr:hypothetical protein [Actinomycetota bacterium]MBI3686690.1 hypothetical protein [Actinomycetota bacterium]
MTAHDAGPRGNQRLTAMAGAVLFVLLAVEGLSILSVRGLFTVHAIVGLVLVGPLMVKLTSATYRFARYYTGDPAYRRAGPPRPLLRLLAPVLIVATLALLATGVTLLLTDPASAGRLVQLHKASFVVWLGVTSVHVLAYLGRVPPLLMADLRRRPAVRGASTRGTLVLLGVLAGALLAVALKGHLHPWVAWFANGLGSDGG